MKKISYLSLTGIIALFLFFPTFSNAQRSKRKMTSVRAKPKTKAAAKQNSLLTPGSFSANGLHNEDTLTNLYLGNFTDIAFDRDNMNFSILYSAYLNAYARRCNAHLPRNKVEMTRQECAAERVTRNGYGVETSRYCIRWVTVGTGLYADPEMYNVKMQLERIQARDGLRTVFGMLTKKDPIAGAMNMAGNAQAAVSDMNSLVRMNACTSSALNRFQENLKSFALNKQPIRLGTNASVKPAVKSPTGISFKNQNYSKLMEDLIYEQSRTWAMNRFVRGSVSGVSVTSTDNLGRPAKITAQYIYNGFNNRSRGSVTLTFTDGHPECMYFYDFPATCRTPNRKIAAAFSGGAYQK